MELNKKPLDYVWWLWKGKYMEYKYFRSYDNKICRIHVERDDQPWDPRYDQDGNIGHMMIWWNRYRLGDYKENKFESPEDFVNNLVRDNVTEKQIINYVKAKKTSNKLELTYNRKERIWELWGYFKYWWTGNEVHHGIIESNYPINFLVDDVIEAMSFEDKWKLLEHNGIVCLPLYIYEHGGMTISTGSFSCPCDSGQAGWIYTSKKEILDTGGYIKSDKGKYVLITNKNWKQAAYQWLEGEVKSYDQYLRGDVYGYIIDELDMDDQSSLESSLNLLSNDDFSWDEGTDSCWGFYSDKFGDELVTEIAREVVSCDLFDRLEDVV